MKFHAVPSVLGLVGIAVLACSSSEDRPGGIADCEQQVCDGLLGGIPSAANRGSGGQASSVGQGGAGAGAGGSNMGSSGVAVLQGTVSVVAQPNLAQSGNPNEELQLLTSSTGMAALSTEVDTDGRFRLDGVSSTRPLWVLVGPASGDSNSVYIDTLQPVRTAAGQPAELLVTLRSVVNDIASQSFQSNPSTLDPERAHAILSLVTTTGEPVPGVSLTNPGLSVAYDAGVIYSDALSETDANGRLVILNVDADPYPGELTTMVFDVGGDEYQFNIYLARGSLTLATFELSP